MLRYVTTNPGKVREAEAYLDEVGRLEFDYPEIQAPELGPIAAHGARAAHRHAGGPVLVDDAGLFVDGLDGFPGPYSSYVHETLGVDCVRRLCERELDAPRRATFRCVLAYCDGDPFDATPDPVDREDRTAAAAAGPDAADDPGPGSGDDDLSVRLFEGVVPGRIVPPRGDGGFGYDPVFEHDGTTFAEMSPEEKNAVSHRGRALAKFAEWYAGR